MKKKGIFHFFVVFPSGKAFFGTAIHVTLSANCQIFFSGGGGTLRKHPFLPSFLSFVCLRVSMRVLPHAGDRPPNQGESATLSQRKRCLEACQELFEAGVSPQSTLCTIHQHSVCRWTCVMAGGVNASQRASDFVCFVFCWDVSQLFSPLSPFHFCVFARSTLESAAYAPLETRQMFLWTVFSSSANVTHNSAVACFPE